MTMEAQCVRCGGHFNLHTMVRYSHTSCICTTCYQQMMDNLRATHIGKTLCNYCNQYKDSGTTTMIGEYCCCHDCYVSLDNNYAHVVIA